MYLGILLSNVITRVYNIKHNEERRYWENTKTAERFLLPLLGIERLI